MTGGRTAAAQATAEIVRGRVIDDSARVLKGATVTITRGPDRLVQTTTTDRPAHNSRFDPGTGDYLVFVTSLGFRSARRRVQRVANEREWSPTLRWPATQLCGDGQGDRHQAGAGQQQHSAFTVEPGSSEAWSSGVNGRVTPGSAGDLNAIAATMPGVTVTPGGPTMMGSANSSNLTTLNGMALAGGQLPRAARMDTRVTGATYDPRVADSPAPTSTTAQRRDS